MFRFNTRNGHWKHFQHERNDSTTITNNSVITLFEDLKGTMWVGTNGGGLCSFDPKTETFIDFDPDNTILPNRVIYSIEQDKTGDFWISSNAGLITINPITKQHFRQFTVNDGLQGNQFTAQSSLKTASGKLYFGGISGFNSFVPINSWIISTSLPYILRKYVCLIRRMNGWCRIFFIWKVPLSCGNHNVTLRT